MSCFRLENVSYRYDKALVLNGVDLRLEPGEILGLFGHNGAGKTTSIKLILGLMTPTQGKVSVLDGDAGDPHVSQHIGYLPENVMFYPQLTGREILNHFARLKGAPPRQVPELLEQVGLGDATNARVKTYSKGMRQRLGLAQALLGKPKLLMLDEPTVGLDPVATADLYRLLRKLRDQGTGIVLCSHVLPGVEPYIDRAAILTDGAVKAVGDLPSLRRQANMPVTLSIEPANGTSALEKAITGASAATGLMIKKDNGRLQVGYASTPATIASLASLGIFLIPLIALLLAYDAIVGEEEGGTLLLLMTYPLSRGQLLFGKFLGHGLTLAFATLLGFGVAGIAIAIVVKAFATVALLAVFLAGCSESQEQVTERQPRSISNPATNATSAAWPSPVSRARKTKP